MAREACWICLSEEDTKAMPLEYPCKCPRPVHLRCLARWQLQAAGQAEENQCRFCYQTLPAWQRTFLAQDGVAPYPIMAICYYGRTYKVRVKPGPEGLEIFKKQVFDLLGLDLSSTTGIQFECTVPGTEEKVRLNGLECYSAATWCAAGVAAHRKRVRAVPPPARTSHSTPCGCPLNLLNSAPGLDEQLATQAGRPGFMTQTAHDAIPPIMPMSPAALSPPPTSRLSPTAGPVPCFMNRQHRLDNLGFDGPYLLDPLPAASTSGQHGTVMTSKDRLSSKTHSLADLVRPMSKDLGRATGAVSTPGAAGGGARASPAPAPPLAAVPHTEAQQPPSSAISPAPSSSDVAAAASRDDAAVSRAGAGWVTRVMDQMLCRTRIGTAC